MRRLVLKGWSRILTFLTFMWCFVFMWLSNTNQEDLLTWMTLKEDDPKDSLLNLHKYSYSINSDICKQNKVDVIIFVHTAVENELRRMKVRDTWAGVKRVEQYSIATVFMLGQTKDPNLQILLENEAHSHKDIVQGNFLDSYRNLTYKHIMGLGWVTEHCPQTKLIVKTDDDVLINVFNMVAYMNSHSYQTDFLYCYPIFLPIAQRNGKWFVGYQEYPFVFYPKYCSGAAFLISPDLAKKLYEASNDIRFFWIDDLYVTGFLRLKTGATITDTIPSHDFLNTSVLTKNFMFLDAQHVWYTQWDYLTKSLPKTISYETKEHS